MFARLYREPAGDGGDAGTGGTGSTAGTDAIAAGLAAAAAASADEAAKAAAAAAAAATGGDKPKPTDEEARLLKEVMQKKEALNKKEADLAAANAKLKEFEGIDAVAVRKILEDQKAAETAALEAKGEWDRLKARMAEEHSAATKSLQDQIAELQGKLSSAASATKEATIGTAFSQSKFVQEETTLTPAKARIIYGDHFDLDESGNVVGYDKPRGAANRTAFVDAQGNSLKFEEAMAKIIGADPEVDSLLKSKVKPGAGSDSKKPDPKNVAKAPADSLSKIGAGLKLANFQVL